MPRRPRLLAIMGSGETAPTMAKVHRALVDRLGDPPPQAVLLDSPYGFQENASEIAQRTVRYFRNLKIRLEVASWRTADDLLAREQALARIAAADYVFAGPGSPTYALRVWERSGLRDVLARKLTSGGCVTFASAAALTLGLVTVPVYEIYKVGATPAWVPGLDLLAEVGLRAAVIPHFDNTEGGTHDTRFCYLGERRLRMLEEMLDAQTIVLGVDEHTAAVFDLDANQVEVLGRGGLTIRYQGLSTVFPAGCTVPIDQLRAPVSSGGPAAAGAAAALDGPGTPAAVPGGPQAFSSSPPGPVPSLRAEAERLEQAFEAGLRARDIAAAATAALELEQAIVDWSADTEETDDVEGPRALLRRMVTRLAELAEVGARDPREVVAPFVEALLELRNQARQQRFWALADMVRERLTAAGIEVRDTPEGTIWLLARSP